PARCDKLRVRAPTSPPLSTIAAGSASALQDVRSANPQSAGKSSSCREEYQTARLPSPVLPSLTQERLTLAASISSSHAGLPKGHEAASSTFQPILNEMRPDELDDSRVVVAVCEVVIQSRKTSAVDRISSCQPAVRHRTSDDRCFPSQMAKHTLGNRAPQCHRSSVNSSW